MNSHEIALDVFQKISTRYPHDRTLTWKCKLKVWFQNNIKTCFNLRNFGSYKVVCYFSYLLSRLSPLHFKAAILHINWCFHAGVAPSELKHLNGSSQNCSYLRVCGWDIFQSHENTVKLIRDCTEYVMFAIYKLDWSLLQLLRPHC